MNTTYIAYNVVCFVTVGVPVMMLMTIVNFFINAVNG